MEVSEIQKTHHLVNTLEDLILRIREHGGKAHFKEFVAERKEGNEPGLSYTNIRVWIRNLKGIRETLQKEKSEALVNAAIIDLKKYESNVKFFQEKVEEFVKVRMVHNRNARKFEIYTYQELRRKKEPFIHVGLLEIKEEANAWYYCAQELPVRSYSGDFILTKDDIGVFNLSSVGNLEVNVQMQVYFRDQSAAELFLGSYLTYENGRIVRGTLVLVPVDESVDLEPYVARFDKKVPSLTDIEPTILEYLSIRKFSYRRVPDQIYTKAQLREFLNGEFHESPGKRFIESIRPEIIIASPNSSISSESFEKNQSIIDTFKKSIETTFPGKLNVYIRNEQMPEFYKEATAPPSIKHIQKTRMFFLIYTPADKASFSLVQLGWAMAHCKQIVVIYQKGSLSSNILRLNMFKDLFNFYEVQDLQQKKTQEHILGIIRKTIIGSLRNYLGA